MLSMTDMAKTPEEVKEDIAEQAMPMAAPANGSASVPAYPYGLCICLTEEELDKLSIGDMPEVGDMIHLMAMAKVTSVNQSENEKADGSKVARKRIELQITHLGVEDENNEDEAPNPRKNAMKRYGTEEAAE